MKAVITRIKAEDKQTTGELKLYNDDDKKILTVKTLELAWLNNQKGKSCIPVGNYNVITRKSAKYGSHFHILDVPGRDYILIHGGNFHYQIKGCVLVGDKLADINGDGYQDVTNSIATLKKLLKLAPNGFTLTVENKKQAPKDAE